MLENVSVLLPYKPDGGRRDLNFKWIIRFYEAIMPEVEICTGISQDKLFNRSKAINLAAKKATRDIFIIADGDIIYDSSIIIDSINKLEEYAIVFPFTKYLNISEEASKKLLKTRPKWPLNISNNNIQIRTPYIEFAGKLNVVSRSTFKTINGFDERFKGWGGEDDAFRCAIITLCGPDIRLDHSIYHLWHPHIGWDNNPRKTESKKLLKLYRKVQGNEEKMIELLQKK
ncbi:galactosyltransferase-related protein [Ammoniphilus sp. 3BR4]|uniref:galactosyltransferase-related protein n=1 Tax=Ammoniphilus sp. 3BR4 TaxID=3158265 RepID=UPI003467D5A6